MRAGMFGAGVFVKLIFSFDTISDRGLEEFSLAGKAQEGAQQARYLLGEGSEAERERLEAEFFSDDDAFQKMLSAEDDLIDAYARGELSATDRRQFQERFLTSADGRERVEFARVFADARGARTIATPVAPSPGFFASVFGNTAAWRVAFAAVAIAAMVGFAWLLVERSRMNTELNELRAERLQLNQKAAELQQIADAERLKNAETLAQLKNLQDRIGNEEPKQDTPGSNRRSGTIDQKETVANDRSNESTAAETNVVFDLNSGSTRGGRANTLRIPRGVASITLRLGLETESSAQDYRALIETANGRAIQTLNARAASVPHDRVQVPPITTGELPSGDYVVFLMAKQTDGSFSRIASYSLRIVKN